MRTVLQIVAKDLRRHRRSPTELALTLAFPLVLAVVLGLVFGSSDGGEGTFSLPPIPMIVVNDDEGFAGGFLLGALEGMGENESPISFAVEALEAPDGAPAPTLDDAVARMRDDGATAALRIPPGFTDAIFDGGTADLELVRNPSERILPEIVHQVLDVTTLLLSEAVRQLDAPLAEIRKIADAGDVWPTDAQVAAVSAIVNARVRELDRFVFPPVVTISFGEEDEEDGGEGAGATGFNIFSYLLPGMTFLGLLFAAAHAFRDIFRERQQGTLARLASSPAGLPAVVAGKFASAAAVAMLGYGILLGSGAIFMGARWGPVLAPVLLAPCAAIAAAGCVSLVYGTARTERQAEALAPIAILSVSFMGGSMIPLDSLPAAIQIISPWTPNYWLIRALVGLTSGDLSITGILPHAGVLLATGLVGGLAGYTMMQRRVARDGGRGG